MKLKNEKREKGEKEEERKRKEEEEEKGKESTFCIKELKAIYMCISYPSFSFRASDPITGHWTGKWANVSTFFENLWFIMHKVRNGYGSGMVVVAAITVSASSPFKADCHIC